MNHNHTLNKQVEWWHYYLVLAGIRLAQTEFWNTHNNTCVCLLFELPRKPWTLVSCKYDLKFYRLFSEHHTRTPSVAPCVHHGGLKPAIPVCQWHTSLSNLSRLQLFAEPRTRCQKRQARPALSAILPHNPTHRPEPTNNGPQPGFSSVGASAIAFSWVPPPPTLSNPHLQ
ncbi:hypothetical protein HRR76_001129 [Exophiala dermatitidis]|nr:hypothetical protein HRR76_001129 [Exophiala dermatitidis]KAJ4563753.1 hypothetical protein HRR82_009377 [Exophiala dermatitidis]KAJ4599266.1 hypothetical protein HRR85_009546 [Exophiala dermatitidis]KAJ4662192.1 hypothetical protein HRR93_009591 [Exophiala dermatitidis]KAJ4664572.1 hypothetical protein HRR95_008981 [Exophiala dermatitidis]